MENAAANYVVIHRIRAKTYGDDHAFDRSTFANCRTPDNFIMLFDSELRSIGPANFFLRDKCFRSGKRKKGRWEKTQAAYADDLAVWWLFLKFMGLNWDEATVHDIKYFVECLMNGVSTKTLQELANTTVRRRVGTVCLLYQWGFVEGYLKSSIGTLDGRSIPNSRSMLAHVKRDHRSEESELLPDDNRKPCSPIGPKDVQLILDQLGPSVIVFDSKDTRPVRDRLIAETSLYTGMREEEIAWLTCYQIMALERFVDDSEPWKPIPLVLTKTKGGDKRITYPPSYLVKAWLHYFDQERSQIIREARNRGKYRSSTDQPTPMLFINSVNSNDRDIAEPISAATITRNFTAAVLRANLVRTELGYEMDSKTGMPVTSPETGARVRIELKVPAHTFHGLRHTFACNLYCFEKALGNSEPWKKVQSRLGHRHMATTVDTYLKCVDVYEHEISDELEAVLSRQLHGR